MKTLRITNNSNCGSCLYGVHCTDPSFPGTDKHWCIWEAPNRKTFILLPDGGDGACFLDDVVLISDEEEKAITDDIKNESGFICDIMDEIIDEDDLIGDPLDVFQHIVDYFEEETNDKEINR